MTRPDPGSPPGRCSSGGATSPPSTLHYVPTTLASPPWPLAHDVPVHTCNPDDFASIDGLRVVAVPVPPQR